MLASHEEKCGTKSLGVGNIPGTGLIKAGTIFPPPEIGSPCSCSQAAISRAVHEDRGGDGKAFFRRGAHGFDRGDPALTVLAMISSVGCGDAGIEQQGERCFRPTLLVENEIKHRGRPLRVTYGIFQSDFLDDSAFARLEFQIPAGALEVCTYDVHPHFAAGVAAQHRTILAKDHLHALTGRSQCARDPRDTASGDKDIASEMAVREMTGERRPAVRGCGGGIRRHG